MYLSSLLSKVNNIIFWADLLNSEWQAYDLAPWKKFILSFVQFPVICTYMIWPLLSFNEKLHMYIYIIALQGNNATATFVLHHLYLLNINLTFYIRKHYSPNSTRTFFFLLTYRQHVEQCIINHRSVYFEC